MFGVWGVSFAILFLLLLLYVKSVLDGLAGGWVRKSPRMCWRNIGTVPNQIFFFYSRRTKSLPSADFELDPSPKDARLVNAFIRGRSSEKTDPADQTLPLYNNDDPGGTLQQQMIRSKDTVNQVCLIGSMYTKSFFFKQIYIFDLPEYKCFVNFYFWQNSRKCEIKVIEFSHPSKPMFQYFCSIHRKLKYYNLCYQ